MIKFLEGVLACAISYVAVAFCEWGFSFHDWSVFGRAMFLFLCLGLLYTIDMEE